MPSQGTAEKRLLITEGGLIQELLIKRALQFIEPLSKRYGLHNEGAVHSPGGLSELYCPFSDGPPIRTLCFEGSTVRLSSLAQGNTTSPDLVSETNR
jgi:hypothetical protein